MALPDFSFRTPENVAAISQKLIWAVWSIPASCRMDVLLCQRILSRNSERTLVDQLSNVPLYLGPLVGSLRGERLEELGLEGPIPRQILFLPLCDMGWTQVELSVKVGSPLWLSQDSLTSDMASQEHGLFWPVSGVTWHYFLHSPLLETVRNPSRFKRMSFIDLPS